jgi:cysteine desulfurase
MKGARTDMARAYLDWNATAPLRPQARAAMIAACELVGNPSSVHAEGRAARALIDHARQEVAALLGADPRRVIFTSGATEANMLALSPRIEIGGDRIPRDRLLVSAIEHPSVRGGGRFPAEAVEEIPVVSRGTVDLAALESRLGELSRAGSRVLVSIMLANNESGVVQPIQNAAEMIHAAGGLLHVDAVQGAGRIPLAMNDLGADLLSISSHKLGGPQGAGALVVRTEALHLADPLIRGGGQERGSRAGTEAVAAIAGFGAAAAAAREALPEERRRVSALRDRFEAALARAAPDAVVFGTEAERVPNTTLFAVPGVKADTAVIALDLEGVAVSSGAACSSGKVQPSHVLAAMGFGPALAKGAIRVSLGYSTTDSEVDRCVNAWKKVYETLHKGSEGIAA